MISPASLQTLPGRQQSTNMPLPMPGGGRSRESSADGGRTGSNISACSADPLPVREGSTPLYSSSSNATTVESQFSSHHHHAPHQHHAPPPPHPHHVHYAHHHHFQQDVGLPRYSDVSPQPTFPGIPGLPPQQQHPQRKREQPEAYEREAASTADDEEDSSASSGTSSSSSSASASSSSSGTSDCGECCAGHAPYPYVRKSKEERGASSADDTTTATVSRGTQISPDTVAEMYAAAAAKAAGMAFRPTARQPPATGVKKKLSFHPACGDSDNNSGVEDKCVQTPTTEAMPAFPQTTSSKTYTFSASGPPEGDACLSPAPRRTSAGESSTSSPSKSTSLLRAMNKANGDAANEIERVEEGATSTGGGTALQDDDDGEVVDGGGGSSLLSVRLTQKDIMRKIGRRIRFRKKKDKLKSENR